MESDRPWPDFSFLQTQHWQQLARRYPAAWQLLAEAAWRLDYGVLSARAGLSPRDERRRVALRVWLAHVRQEARPPLEELARLLQRLNVQLEALASAQQEEILTRCVFFEHLLEEVRRALALL